MQFESKAFQIDPTPRRADGEYIAHARISRALAAQAGESQIHASGDLAAFDSREDAIAYARQWAIAWIDEHYGPSERGGDDTGEPPSRYSPTNEG